MIITDSADARLADYLDLADPGARRRRERDEIFIAEGLTSVERLIESGHPIRSILVTPKKRGRVEPLVANRDITVYVADEDVLAATVGFNLHRGVVAAAERRPLPAVGDVIARSSRVGVLEGLNDPENLGLIARSARAFGFDALLLDPTCIDPYYRRTVRVSMGEVLLLAVTRFEAWPDGLAQLHAAGFETWAMTPAADATSIWTLAVPGRLAIVLGAEGHGLAASTVAASSRQVRIPISSDVDSLNVGHAAAIAFAVAARPA
ncbi:MAG: TrmH family RNA methyltransferase [Acidimicrobiales bacterium]